MSNILMTKKQSFVGISTFAGNLFCISIFSIVCVFVIDCRVALIVSREWGGWRVCVCVCSRCAYSRLAGVYVCLRTCAHCFLFTVAKRTHGIRSHIRRTPASLRAGIELAAVFTLLWWRSPVRVRVLIRVHGFAGFVCVVSFASSLLGTASWLW